jgi:hypothetical protein
VSYQLGVERKLTEKSRTRSTSSPRASWPGPCATSPSAAGSASTRPGASVARNSCEAPRGTVENLMEILGAVQRLAGDAMRPAIDGQAVEIPEALESPDENGASRP